MSAGRRTAALTLAALAAFVAFAGTSYAHPVSPEGHTTEEQSTEAGPPLDPAKPGFLTLQAGDPWPRVVRELPDVAALPGRDRRRVSLAYFGQLTDFQLADEESPARVEFADQGAASAWRPQEPFHPFAIDFSFRALNAFTGASPHAQGDGTRAPMDLALSTGDQSDNQQRNETVWVRKLIEGGEPLDPNSGVESSYSECGVVGQAALQTREQQGLLADEPVYTGVADNDDQPFDTTAYYDPDQPAGGWEDWPRYGGLLDRAQQAFTPVGLRRGSEPVPTYLTNGNHDGLVQGNEDAIRAFEDIATGCFKPFVPTAPPSNGEDPPPSLLLGAVTGFFVRPDEERRFVDRAELKEIYSAGIQADDHGFAYVDPEENLASNFSATYYSWDAKPGLRFVSIDTVSDGGVIESSSNGNIDNPQWQWLEDELDAAEAQGKVVVLFGHHPIRSLTAQVPDELAAPCTVDDEHGHDVNPGCDLDPRLSAPVHLGDELRALLSAHPNVIAYVAGHTHENEVLACGSEDGCPAGGNWWEINTSAVADWPQQSRLIEVMDNGDGTLSLFGSLLDHASAYALPQATGDASGLTDEQLAALGRAFSFNDPQAAHAPAGQPQDQNVELIVDDPRD
jgi:metallophosphoesterase (TIGR03767 family)